MGHVGGEVLSTEATIELWRRRNGCSSTVDRRLLSDQADDNVRVEHSVWSECSGAPIEEYRIIGGGHTWPGGTQYLPVKLIGRVTHDIDAATEIWSFFSTFESR